MFSFDFNPLLAVLTNPENTNCLVNFELIHYNPTTTMWNVYQGTNVSINLVTNKVDIYTEDLNLDVLPTPVTEQFGLCAFTPDFFTATGLTLITDDIATGTTLPTWTTPANPICIELDITWKHPCRFLIITNQDPLDMATAVQNPVVSVDVSRFVHSLESEPRDCGTQTITVVD